VPEDVMVWRYFESQTLHQNAERLLGAELRDLGFIDVTLGKDVALEHLPAAHPVLAGGALDADQRVLEDADLLLAPGTRFRITHAGREDGLLNVHLEIIE
jgi:hypothetical protein